MKNPGASLPQVRQIEQSQEVLFREKIGAGEGTWTSSSVKLLQNNWSFRFIRSGGKVDFRFKFEGPAEKIAIHKAILVLGKSDGVNPLGNPSTNSLIEVVKEITFQKLEARLIRDLCSLSTFEAIMQGTGVLEFSVKLVKIDSRASFERPQLPSRVVGAPAVPEKKMSLLEGQVARLTLERDNLHKSVQKLTFTDSEVSFLNESTQTQPEVIRQYDGFKQASRSVVFQLLSLYKPEKYGEIMNNFVKRIQRRVRTGRQEKFEQILKILDIDPADKSAQSIAEQSFRQIVRATGHIGLNKLSPSDGEELRKLIATCELEELENEAELFDYGKFIWSLVNYMYGNNNLFVSWEAFGSVVKFDRGKFSSISRRCRAGEDCILVIPILQRKPFGNINKNPDDYEALCLGLVCPL